MGRLSEKFNYYKEETGEYVETVFNHVRLPDNLDSPVIDGIERTMNLGITRASGWHYSEDAMLFIPAYRKVSGQSLSFKITLFNKEGKVNSDGLIFEFANSRSFSKKIPLADIFSVVFGVSDADQIRSLVGTNSEYLTSRYLKPKKGEALLRAIRHPKISNTVDLSHKLRIMLTKQTMIDAPERLYDMLGLHHFIGCSLAEDIEVGNMSYSKFSVVDEQLVFALEHSGLDTVSLLTTEHKKIDVSIFTPLYTKVNLSDIGQERISEFRSLEVANNTFEFNGEVYHKPGVPSHNTLEVYCALINRLFAFHESGINFSMQDYKNQKIVTFRDKIRDFENEDIESVMAKIDTVDNLLEGVSGHRFDIGRAERLIKNADSALAVITKNENPIAKTSQGKVLVRDVEYLAREAVQVLPQDLGLIDPVDSAESKNIGKTTPLTMTSEIDEKGALYTPLYKVVNGEVTDEVEMVHVGDLPNLFVAQHGVNLKGNVLAKHRGEVKLFPCSVVTHTRVSPFSTTSACRATSVFMENTDQKRTQMTANAQKQARAILRPSRALVETGVESIAANGDTGLKHVYTVRDILIQNGIDPSTIEDNYFDILQVSDTGMSKEYRLFSTTDSKVFGTFSVTTEKSSYGSSYYYELVAPAGLEDFYSLDDVVYKQHNIVFGGNVEGTERLEYHTKGKEGYFDSAVANGQDLFVMFGFSESFTVDDASVISDRVVRDMSLATPVLVTKRFEKDKIFDKNIVEHFGTVSGVIPEGFGGEGLPLVGTYLRPGVKWLYRYEENKEDGNLVRKDLRLSDSEQGEVIAVENGKEEIKVTLAKWVHVQVGDKMGGRHGNKTIISKVMPAEMMPFDPVSGRRIDMIINPLGIPSRGNISQLAELQKSTEIKAKGIDTQVIPPFSNELMKMVENYEQGKELTELQLINPKTGLYYPKKHFCGYMYYLRNAKIAEDQLHAIGDSSEIDVAFLQPVGGSELHEKGQSISSMEKEILVSYGAGGILDEIHSVLSADRTGFRAVSEYFEDHVEARAFDYDGVNFHVNHMQHVALAFHISMKQEGEEILFDYMSDEDMSSFVEVDPKQIEFGLTDRVFLDTMMYIQLPSKFITPTAIRKFKFTNIVHLRAIDHDGKRTPGKLGIQIIEKIIEERMMFIVVPSVDRAVPSITVFPIDLAQEHINKYRLNDYEAHTGMASIIKLLEDYPMELWVNDFKERNGQLISDDGVFDEGKLKILQRAEAYLKRGGFERFMTSKFPVLPNKYRQAKNEINNSDSLTAAYKDIIRLGQDLERSSSAAPRLYNRMSELLLPSKSGATSKSLFEFFAKKDTGGRIRGKILKTRVLCSMRSTIVPMFSGDPKEYGYPSFAGHPDSIGLPLAGAIRIAQPRVLAFMKANHPDVIADKNLTEIDAVSKIIDIITLPYDSVEEITGWEPSTIPGRVKELKEQLIEHVNGSFVFYGRAPSLQETSLRGGRVYIHEEKVIHLHSLLTTDLNADHDGDQIYVVMPITAEAIKDIEEKLLPSVNAIRYNDGKPSLLISQDALLGLYFATEPSTDEVVYPVSSIAQAKHFFEIGKLKLNNNVILTLAPECQIKSTVGRLVIHDIIFNLGLSSAKDMLVQQEDGFYSVYYDRVISGDGADGGIDIATLQTEIAKRYPNPKVVTDIYNNIQKFGYYCAERRNLTVGIYDLTPVLQVESVNTEIKRYVEVARTLEELGMLPDDYLVALDSKASKLIESLDIMSKVPEDNAFKILAKSGAKGKKASIEKMFGITGFVNANNGEKLSTPILSNTVRGISQFQVEDLSYTQRDNAISTVFETSKPGETLRSGAFELSGLIIQDNSEESLGIEQLVYYVRKSDTVKLGKTRKSAKVITEAEDYHYKGRALDSDVIRQLLGTESPEIKLDEEGMFLYLDVELHPFAKAYFNHKMDLDGKPVSEVKLKKMLSTLPSHIPLSTHANEFDQEYGISQKNAGYRAGSRNPYSLGENVGIKSSTATAQPANQLVISKRNMDRAGGLDNGIDLFKAAIQSVNFYKNDHTSYELLAPENGVIEKATLPTGTALRLISDSGKTYTHFVKVEEEHMFTFPFKNGDLVFTGQTIVGLNKIGDGERAVSPLKSFVWDQVTLEVETGYGQMEMITYKESLINPSTDLVQLIRFYFMTYLESIYRANKINLDPTHYGSFALQASRYCTVLKTDVNAQGYDLGYLNLSKYFRDVKDVDLGTVVKMELTNGSDTIMLTAGPVSALCYRDAITVAAKASVAGPLPEFGSLSKVALGISLDESLADKHILKEQVSKRKVKRITLEEQGESTVYELSEEEEQDVFGNFDWGDGEGSGTAEDIFGSIEEKPAVADDIFATPIEEEEEELEVDLGEEDYREPQSHESTQSKIADVNTSSIFGGN